MGEIHPAAQAVGQFCDGLVGRGYGVRTFPQEPLSQRVPQIRFQKSGTVKVDQDASFQFLQGQHPDSLLPKAPIQTPQAFPKDRKALLGTDKQAAGFQTGQSRGAVGHHQILGHCFLRFRMVSYR